MKCSLDSLKRELQAIADSSIAEHSKRYFKTGPGEYAEGDLFYGIRVPILRKIAKEFRELSLLEIGELLRSPIHEERLLALFLMASRYKRSDDGERKKIYDLYCSNTEFINNWDLVDSSSHLIAGEHLRTRSRKPLHQWAKSKVLWERRIAMIATLAYIRENDFQDALAIAEILLTDHHDLIHKATGWMLREIGERELGVELEFLDRFAAKMPRTMLRYAIEKLPDRARKAYLGK